MLSRKEVFIRYIICFSCFFLSGSELITGWLATISGVVGTIELATALLRYSPLAELRGDMLAEVEPQKVLEPGTTQVA